MKRAVLPLLLLFALAACGKKTTVTLPLPPPPPPPAPVVPYSLAPLPALNTLDPAALGWPNDAGVQARLDRLAALEDEPDAARRRDLLQLALADTDPTVRMAALRRLDQIPAAQAAALIAALLRIEPTAEVRRQALELPRKWEEAVALPVLVTALNVPDKDIKLIAIDQLTFFSSKPALGALLPALRETDQDLRDRVNDKLEFLVDRRFISYEEAATWWAGHADQLDAELFKKE
jgi:hypothetical protein